MEAGEVSYHAYVFATLRQLGSGYEYAAIFLRWLSLGRDSELEDAAQQFETISRIAKMLILKLARIVASGRSRSVMDQFEGMAAAWETGVEVLEKRIGLK